MNSANTTRIPAVVACVIVAALYMFGAAVDGPTETDALQASALDHADAIAEARAAGMGGQP